MQYKILNKQTGYKTKRRKQMNAMKDFYASLSSARPQGSYLEALSEITKINRTQAKTLMGDLWWQSWEGPDQKTAAQGM